MQYPMNKLFLAMFVSSAVLMTGCGSDSNSSSPVADQNEQPAPDNDQEAGGNPAEEQPQQEEEEEQQPTVGHWVTGDIHVHTAVSNDARSPLSDVLDHAFNDFDLDYLGLSNHMRNNSQTNDDANIGRPMLFGEALTEHELPGVAELVAANENYQDRLIYSSFEWDMPAHEHYNVGILWDDEVGELPIEKIKEFEYRFSNQNNYSDFAEEDRLAWAREGITRENATHRDAIAALTWLQENFPQSSYGMLNHPLRYADSYTISDVRELNDAAPDVFFLAEGMVGNQFNGNRGDYGGSSLDGVYGGADPVLAELGGWWDALLGEGRKIWNMGNSDHHFKTRNPYASGYYPGEYAKTYTWVAGEEGSELTTQTLLSGLRSGNSFAVFGDLIDALDFSVNDTQDDAATMGQSLEVANGETVTVTIRFRQPEYSKREQTVGDENFEQSMNPGVDHVDLIVGDVGEKAAYGTAAYSKQTNDSTHVAKTFTVEDWSQGEDGFFTMSYTFVAEKDQYLRLRGTNLGANVAGLTVNGEPQRSAVVGSNNGALQYYEDLNERNYGDVWFYSNPIFVSIAD